MPLLLQLLVNRFLFFVNRYGVRVILSSGDDSLVYKQPGAYFLIDSWKLVEKDISTLCFIIYLVLIFCKEIEESRISNATNCIRGCFHKV